MSNEIRLKLHIAQHKEFSYNYRRYDAKKLIKVAYGIAIGIRLKLHMTSWYTLTRVSDTVQLNEFIYSRI